MNQIFEPIAQDNRMTRAVVDYLAAWEAGQRPNRQEFLAQHADIADALAECLDGLDFIQSAAPALRDSTPPATQGDVVQPECPLGDFRIVREVGRGGMGIVYEAVQISLGRRVALKVLPFASTLDPKQLQRFKNEAQAAAHLQHQNIVPVHFVGCERGVHFYAMQFVEGHTLAQLIAEMRQQQRIRDQKSEVGDQRSGVRDPRSEALGSGLPTPQKIPTYGLPDSPGPFPSPERFPATSTWNDLAAATKASTPVPPRSSTLDTRSSAFFRTVANLGIQAAEALEHAHQLGVIHRDIKPANLMIETGSPLAPWGRGDGGEGAAAPGLRLWITDFGLAHCQGGCELTMSGDLLGTLRYMSPEQALAKRISVDERTDIYSLGVTLYELLTLEPAFPGTDRQEVLRKIAFEEPKPPRRFNKGIPEELETIVLKAMEKNPEDRYGLARQLSEDLQHFLDDKPIRARRPTWPQRFRKWTLRHPGVVRTAIGALLAAVVILGLSTAWIMQAQLNERAERQRAEDNAAQAIARLFISDMRLAQRAWEDNQIGWLLELLEGQRPEHTGGKDLRGFEWHYWWRLTHWDSLTLKGHTGGVLSVAYSPDGKRIVSGSSDNTIKVWDAASGQETLTLQGHTLPVLSVAFSPDGKWIVSGSRDGALKVWNAISGQEIRTINADLRQFTCFPHLAWVTSVAFSPDGKQIASGGHDHTVRVWDATTGQETMTLWGHAHQVWSVAYSPDGKRIVSAGWDGRCKVWDAITGQETLTLQGPAGSVRSVAYSPDGKRIVSGCQIWDAATGQEVLTLKGHTGSIRSVAYSPDSKRIVSSSHDKSLKIWDAASGLEIRTLRGHTESVHSVAYSPDGKRLLSCSRDTTVKVWDAAIGQETLTLKGHPSAVWSVGFSRDSKRIVSSSNIIKVWDAANGQETLTFKVRSMDRSADGKGNVLPSVDYVFNLWDLETGESLPLKVHPGAVRSAAFSPDGKRIVSSSSDDRIKVWDAQTGQDTLTLKGHPGVVWSVGLSPDGKRIITGSADNIIRVWDAATGDEIRSLKGHTERVRSVAYSPDSVRIVSASDDGTLKVWDAANGQETLTLKGHTGMVISVAYSPDGKRIVSGGHDNTLKIWDAVTGQEKLTLKGHTGSVNGVAYSPNGKRIVSGSEDKMLKVWDAATGQETLTLKGHTQGVTSVAYSPDGDRIVSGSEDATIKIWDATPMDE